MLDTARFSPRSNMCLLKRNLLKRRVLPKALPHEDSPVRRFVSRTHPMWFRLGARPLVTRQPASSSDDELVDSLSRVPRVALAYRHIFLTLQTEFRALGYARRNTPPPPKKKQEARKKARNKKHETRSTKQEARNKKTRGQRIFLRSLNGRQSAVEKWCAVLRSLIEKCVAEKCLSECLPGVLLPGGASIEPHEKQRIMNFRPADA